MRAPRLSRGMSGRLHERVPKGREEDVADFLNASVSSPRWPPRSILSETMQPAGVSMDPSPWESVVWVAR